MRVDYDVVDNKLVQTTKDDALATVFVNPDAEERTYLTETLEIDEHTLTSALDPDELPRLEFEPEHTVLIFKNPKNYSATDELLLKAMSVGVFLFKDRVVVVASEDIPSLNIARFARVKTATDFLLYLLYRSIFHFREHLKVINMISDNLQDEIKSSMDNRKLIDLFTLQKSMVYYLYAIQGNGALMDKLKSNAAKIRLSVEQLESLDDIIVENNQCFRQAEIYANILASLMDARASIVSNNLNVLMKTLNLITIFIMLPTFVVSAFSMNVDLPWNLKQQPYAFWIIMGLAFLSIVGGFIFWRHKKW
ncbi:MAG TPA: magnesium transporter CorA family protein [Candidatus Latescibacteria bacterium]|nr:magnesium transporter CorA family protein [Candidatus Latescibacterota bacterium]